MTKPAKTAAELIELAKSELQAHMPYPEGIVVSVLSDGDGFEFRVSADEETRARAGYPEAVALLVQIGDQLSRQYSLRS